MTNTASDPRSNRVDESLRRSPPRRNLESLLSTHTASFCGTPIAPSDGTFEELRVTRHTASPAEIRERFLAEDYVYIRGLLSRRSVLAARAHILRTYAIMGEVDDRYPVENGVSTGRSHREGINVRAVRRAIVDSPAVQQVVGAPAIARAAAAALGSPATRWSYIWPRVLAEGSGTGLHQDAPFLRGPDASAVLSTWMPLGDIGPSEGSLIVLSGSHTSRAFRKEYGDLDADRDPDFGWYSDRLRHAREKHPGTWLTTDFRMGDVLFFGLHTLHGALDNTTPSLRVTIDTRWQRSDTPIDPRWSGSFPTGRHPDRIFLPMSVGTNKLNKGLRTEFHWIDDLGRPKEKP